MAREEIPAARNCVPERSASCIACVRPEARTLRQILARPSVINTSRGEEPLRLTLSANVSAASSRRPAVFRHYPEAPRACAWRA